jgi:RNA recognition motif-containing protein
VFVYDIHLEVTYDDINSYFSKAGPIIYIKYLKGKAFIKFVDEEG